MENLEAKSLRIGNLVRYSDKNETPSPIVIQVGIQDLILISESVKGCNYEPIPLTEEWLLKCGFESDTIFGFNIKYKKGNFELWYSKQKNIFLVENLKIIKCEPKYLHQLQNLYFALTSTELIIKL